MKMKNNKKSSLRSFRMRLLKEDLWEKLREKRVINPPPRNDRTQLGTNVSSVKKPCLPIFYPGIRCDSDLGFGTISHRIDG